MLTTTMLKLFDNIVPLQAEENETPHREPAGWPSKGKIQQYKVLEDKSKNLVKRDMFALFKSYHDVGFSLAMYLTMFMF